eukprot:NODE_2046_length_2306_cov_9.444240.p1 GENE.NODE_2046_length_2306_cov_9.444240~~NODE_2046_length_2306_cov_9.444240.p1  ORF type:complete len:488 (-),score=148.61 NODE_2046_length_2306_cov_9.444240:337-1800(-)
MLPRGARACVLVTSTAAVIALASAAFIGGGGGGSSNVPAGVNVGGWLVLEDWMFSGAAGHLVRSASPNGQGACLPPNVVTPPAGGLWRSEGLLTSRLVTSLGTSATAEALTAHRQSFIRAGDFRAMVRRGVRMVRVPLPWSTFADALARLGASTYAAHDANADVAIVPDPYYTQQASFATVPRTWLADTIAAAGAMGLVVLLELQSFPGGAASGTFSGVWPLSPAFWTASVKAYSLTEIGLWLVSALVRWVESLTGAARAAVGGVCLMNAPAQLAASQGFATEEAVLSWLAAAAAVFRNSSLPSRGVRLYVNIADSAFKDFGAVVPPWWSNTFTAEERSTWAVMDRHMLLAWSSTCDGRTGSGGGYRCDDDVAKVRTVLRRCAESWASSFARDFEGKRACAAFSLGTYRDTLEACNSSAVLDAFLEEQLAALSAHNIEPYFWTWRMPYAPTFEAGWSLAHHLGVESASPASMCVAPTVSTPVRHLVI